MNCIRKKFNTNVRFTFLYFGKIYDFNFKIKIHDLKVVIGAEEDSLQFFSAVRNVAIHGTVRREVRGA